MFTIEKKQGIHYTPKDLAKFLAENIIHYSSGYSYLSVCDPAIGDGELILQFLNSIDNKIRVEGVFGFDVNSNAIQVAKKRLSSCENINLINTDFLEYLEDNNLINTNYSLFNTAPSKVEKFDIVISNPPYVRTQVLGKEKSKLISEKFNLNGRIDLYYAFIVGIHKVLKEGGLLGIIVSNRFMTTSSGKTIRKYLRSNFEILRIWDLGDTGLFSAAVLPAVLLLRKKKIKKQFTKITSIYSTKDRVEGVSSKSIFEIIDQKGIFLVKDKRYEVSQGFVGNAENDSIWYLTTTERMRWLNIVKQNTKKKFGEIGKIRVGVKTNNDKVFIRDDWSQVGNIETEVLCSIITHYDANRYRMLNKPRKKILYPHRSINGKKSVIDLSQYPEAKKYLLPYKKELQGRDYLIQANRKWYELWVPQNPKLWSLPKLVFWDITEKPTFWLDYSGAIVNGDCYWMVCDKQADINYLWLALGVANSDFICKFYDYTVNNKLYQGRRRFMTQYVEKFPIPDIKRKLSQKIIFLTKKIYTSTSCDVKSLEVKLNELIFAVFGVN